MYVHIHLSNEALQQEVRAGKDPGPKDRTLEVNVSSLSEEDRACLLEVVWLDDNRWRCKPTLDEPTLEAILAAAREKRQKEAAEEEKRRTQLERIEAAPDEELKVEYYGYTNVLHAFHNEGRIAVTVEKDDALFERLMALHKARQEEKDRQAAERMERERQQREQARQQREAAQQEARALFGQWVETLGSPSQKARYTEGLLPEGEMLDRIRSEVFACLEPFPRYDRLDGTLIEHGDECYETEVEYDVEEAEELTEEQYGHLVALREAFTQAQGQAPDLLRVNAVTFDLRRHVGKCRFCSAEEERYAVLVTVTFASFTLSREYNL